jgi:polygalacturonase
MVVDVRAFGARGDGEGDDTGAFQRAVDALPARGGTVRVRAGRYRIDPVRSVRLRDGTHLDMAADAVLEAIPNDRERGYVLLARQVSDVRITGGRIVGDRDRHRGNRGEWGHGIQLRGASGVTIRGIRIERCWGDGICIGGARGPGGRTDVIPTRDVSIADVHCIGNRRQGLTIGRSRRVRVVNSIFAGTAGTAPQAGIDVEPDPGDFARDVVIEHCTVRGNRGPGIQLYRHVEEVAVRGCVIEKNRGHGIIVIGARDGELAGNTLRGNGLGGIAVRPGSADFLIRGNAIDRDGNKAIAVASKARNIRVADNILQGAAETGLDERDVRLT